MQANILLFMKLTSSFLLLLLSACAGIPTPVARRQTANHLAAAQGWQGEYIAGEVFNLLAYHPKTISPDKLLTVYLEGDGHAWQTSRRPSTDPSPLEPLVLRLALAHPAGNAAYLARPCQYADESPQPCNARYWTGARFAPEVIAASSQAIDLLKTRFGAERLTLVGYSGGAAVATLLAQNRTDVERLITVAGNIDHKAWTTFHRVTPLSESLDPMLNRTRLGTLPQWHFVGSQDSVVPSQLVATVTLGMPNAKIITINGYNHTCCWADHWPQLWASMAKAK